MNILLSLYNELIYRPFFNLLIFLYNLCPEYGIGFAVILLTVIVRLLLYQMNNKALKNQQMMQELQPEIRAIQQKYKKDEQRQAQELLAVYKKYKFNPFSGCLPILIQIPIILTLYSVLLNGLQGNQLNLLYSFVHNPGYINAFSFGINLAVTNVFLAILAAALQGVHTLMLVKSMKKTQLPSVTPTKDQEGGEQDISAQMQDMVQNFSKTMMYALPVITLFITLQMPSGLALYWSVTTVFAVVQQYVVNNKKKQELANK